MEIKREAGLGSRMMTVSFEFKIKVDIKHTWYFFQAGLSLETGIHWKAWVFFLFLLFFQLLIFFSRAVDGFRFYQLFSCQNPPRTHLLRNMCTCQSIHSSQKCAFQPPQIKTYEQNSSLFLLRGMVIVISRLADIAQPRNIFLAGWEI